jgi:diguanylate cyclase (GGDEF)-like protein
MTFKGKVMKSNIILNVVTESPLFSKVPENVLNKFLTTCPIYKLKKGQILIAPGEKNKNIYMVLSGVLTVNLDKPDNPPIRIVPIGETVGELSLIGSTKTSAYILSKGMSEVLIINEKTFWAMVDEIPLIAKNLLHILSGWIVSDSKTTIDHQKQIGELEVVAKIDGLTGIYNRRYFDELLSRFMVRSVQENSPLSLIMIDVDNFKKYNDSNGHIGGDQALIALAQTMNNTVYPGDFVFRYGGEEFSIILPTASLERCKNFAERLRIAVMETDITMPDGLPLPSITISMGIAESLLDGDSDEAILKRADKKLYQAKQEGRNRFCS